MPIKEQQVRKYLAAPPWVCLRTHLYTLLLHPVIHSNFLVFLLEICGRLVSFITLIHTHTTKLYMYCHRFFINEIFVLWPANFLSFFRFKFSFRLCWRPLLLLLLIIILSNLESVCCVCACVCVLARVYVRCVSLLYRIDYIKKTEFAFTFSLLHNTSMHHNVIPHFLANCGPWW